MYGEPWINQRFQIFKHHVCRRANPYKLLDNFLDWQSIFQHSNQSGMPSIQSIGVCSIRVVEHSPI